MRVLAIGAHPDDIELGCGGTLIKLARAGHSVSMYVLTRGSASGDAVQRSNELLLSAKFIGAEHLWIDNFEDATLELDSTLINHIQYFIKKSDPDLIFTHSKRDYHHDHRAISEATIEAGRNHQNILSYEIPLTKEFDPQIFYDVTDTIDKKVELIGLFASQREKIFTRPRSIKGLAEYRAFQNRLPDPITHVEAFEVRKLCMAKNFELFKAQPVRLMQATESPGMIEYSRGPESLEHQMIDRINASDEGSSSSSTIDTGKVT